MVTHSSQPAAREPVRAAQGAELAKALGACYPGLSEYLGAPNTTLHSVPLPALFPPSAQLYRVYHPTPYHPIVFMVGLTGGVAYPLTGHPERFIEMAQAAGVAVDSADTALAYVRAWLETTRPARQLFYLVSALDELEFVLNPTDEERAEIATFERDYGKLLRPPQANADSSGTTFTVTLFAVRDRALERHTLTVARDGGANAAVETLAERLPLVEGG
jgi:hypothetical protein